MTVYCFSHLSNHLKINFKMMTKTNKLYIEVVYKDNGLVEGQFFECASNVKQQTLQNVNNIIEQSECFYLTKIDEISKIYFFDRKTVDSLIKSNKFIYHEYMHYDGIKRFHLMQDIVLTEEDLQRFLDYCDENDIGGSEIADIWLMEREISFKIEDLFTDNDGDSEDSN